ncbi:MAG: UDP-glucose 4-epimerase GalE [Spirochaetales bacterium]|nr:UDP-glucose 4-epimerase GalE [Spirochaetales bacterium]
MKVLVIGGAGYIGSHVSRELLDKNHDVTVFDNLSSGTRENIFREETFIQGDILDTDALDSVMTQGFDALIHLAAFKAAGESMIKPEKYSVNNISGSINILNSAVKHAIKAIVFSSSAATYGEPQYNPIDENHPQNPINFYGYTKLQIEGLMRWYDQLKGLKYASLRYFNAAGYDVKGRITGLEEKPENLIPVIMEVASGKREKLKIFGDDYDTRDGTGIRDYIHVTDLAVAHVMALEHVLKTRESLTVNLGSDQGISVMEMIDAAKTHSGKEIPVEIVARRPGDPATLYATSKKASELLGWKAKYSDVDSIIKTTWKVYKKHL